MLEELCRQPITGLPRLIASPGPVSREQPQHGSWRESTGV